MSFLSEQKECYREALKNNWSGMLKYYEHNAQLLMFPMTIYNDTPFHMAAYSEKEEPLKSLLNILFGPDEGPLPIGMMKNTLGDTPLHAAVIAGNIEAVKILVKRDTELISTKNKSGETPLFRAAAFGETTILRFFLSHPGYKRYAVDDNRKCLFAVHRQRDDDVSILHVAVEGGHFDTALLLLKYDRSLPQLRDKSEMTSLHVLANMPSAFRSGYDAGIFKKFIYYWFPIDDDDEEDDAKKPHGGDINLEDDISRVMPDLEGGPSGEDTNPQIRKPHDNSQEHDSEAAPSKEDTDIQTSRNICAPFTKVLKKINIKIWSFIVTGWPVMETIWKEKKGHAHALKLAKSIIEQDDSWFKVTAEEDRTESLTQGKNKAPDQDTTKSSTEGKKKVQEPLFIATSTGKREVVEEIIKNYPQYQDTTKSSTEGNSKAQDQTTKSPSEGKKKVQEPLFIATSTGIKEIVEEIIKNYPQYQGNKKVQDPLFIAASTGIKEIVEEIIENYPQAVDILNDDGQDVLHVAVMHRQREIFQYLKRWRIPLHKMSRRIDNNGYTLLHQVADTLHYPGGKNPGPALQLQEELEWFEEVKTLIPSYYVMHRDKEQKQTGREMFNCKHKEQLDNAQKWIINTSQSCSAVAVLVATVVFAAAYTAPGGYEKGIPIFLHKSFFIIFTVMDVISLACSLTSVVMFLSILTSPFEYEDFLHSIPRKLTVGFTLLFFSVMTTMIAFGSTILLTIQLEKNWTASLISIAAFLPVSVFALVQFRLYLAILSSAKDVLKAIRWYLPGFCLPTLCFKKMPCKCFPVSVCNEQRPPGTDDRHQSPAAASHMLGGRGPTTSA